MHTEKHFQTFITLHYLVILNSDIYDMTKENETNVKRSFITSS